MATQVKHRRGSKSEINSFTPAIGEIVMDTSNNEIVLGDGAKQGGYPIPRKDSVVLKFDTLSQAIANTGLEVGYTLQTVERTSGNGGGASWCVVLTSTVTPNGFDIVQSISIPTLSLQLVIDGITSAASIGCVLDNITDDFDALTRLHELGVTYSLDGKTAYCSGTLEPKSRMTIYPFGGGIRKDTPGWLFSRNGVCDRFIIEKGGLFLGDSTADFVEMDGPFGYGNAWTNCEINSVSSSFVKGFRLSNARRCTIKGRHSANQAIDYVNKSAECDIQFANFIHTGDLAGSYGLRCADEGDGYPEGLVMQGGMLFNFEKNLDLEEFFEVNINSVECAASSLSTYQIYVKNKTGGFARGLYFDSHCHFSNYGMKFGNDTDVAPHQYDCVIDGMFRGQDPGTAISITKFQHDIHVKDGTLFRTNGVTGTRIAVVATSQNQGITVGGIKCYGYNSYVQLKGSGAKNNVRDIPNMSGITGTPVFFEYAVDYNNVQGMSNIISAQKIDPVTVAASDIIKSATLNLGEGTYLVRTSMTVSAVTSGGTLQLGITPTGAGVVDLADGSGWSSSFKTIDASEKHFEHMVVATVKSGGEFTVDVNSQSAAFTTNGFHDFLSVERV